MRSMQPAKDKVRWSESMCSLQGCVRGRNGARHLAKTWPYRRRRQQQRAMVKSRQQDNLRAIGPLQNRGKTTHHRREAPPYTRTSEMPRSDPKERYRRSAVDYALISLRIAVERVNLLGLSKVSLRPWPTITQNVAEYVR